jgi:DtxR family Mn-dependent transcriptional regulator
MQDYLAEAYRIAAYQDSPYVSTSTLAQEMGVSAPAVARMATRLREGGYIEHEPYQGMKLTPKGEREALQSIRRHRLVEVYLVKVMGFGWHEVHEEADALGAAVTKRLVDRMEEMAGFPTRCPHGEPIPNRDGVMPKVNDVCLADLEPPQSLIVSRVHTHDTEKLKYIEELGLIPGNAIKLVNRAPFSGPLRLEIDRYEQVIGAELAGVLRVELQNSTP